MIQLIRIDDRLLHRQVAYSWKAALSYDAIIIANDDAASDEIRKAALKMATPSGVRLAVRGVKAAAELALHPKLAELKVFVICANPKDVYDFLNQIDKRPAINVGGMQFVEGKSPFAKAVYLDQTDVDYLDKIKALGCEIDVRQTPAEQSQSFQNLRSKFNQN